MIFLCPGINTLCEIAIAITYNSIAIQIQDCENFQASSLASTSKMPNTGMA